MSCVAGRRWQPHRARLKVADVTGLNVASVIVAVIGAVIVVAVYRASRGAVEPCSFLASGLERICAFDQPFVVERLDDRCGVRRQGLAGELEVRRVVQECEDLVGTRALVRYAVLEWRLVECAPEFSFLLGMIPEVLLVRPDPDVVAALKRHGVAERRLRFENYEALAIDGRLVSMNRKESFGVRSRRSQFSSSSLPTLAVRRSNVVPTSA